MGYFMRENREFTEAKMKLTCKYLKSIIPPRLSGKVYKSDSNVRINLENESDALVEYLRDLLRNYGLVMFRDDLVHLPDDYIVSFEL